MIGRFRGVCAGMLQMLCRVTLTLQSNLLTLEATRAGTPVAFVSVDLWCVVSVHVPNCHSEDYPELILQNVDGTTVCLKMKLGMAETTEVAGHVAAFLRVRR